MLQLGRWNVVRLKNIFSIRAPMSWFLELSIALIYCTYSVYLSHFPRSVQNHYRSMSLQGHLLLQCSVYKTLIKYLLVQCWKYSPKMLFSGINVEKDLDMPMGTIYSSRDTILFWTQDVNLVFGDSSFSDDRKILKTLFLLSLYIILPIVFFVVFTVFFVFVYILLHCLWDSQ